MREKGLILVSAMLRGLIFFGVVMGIAMACIMLNARWSPDLVWFPLPAVAVLWLATRWAQQRWQIGLNPVAAVSATRAYAAGLTVTLLGVAVCVVQGSYTGMVRETEVFAGADSVAFTLTYAVLMAVFAGVLAEVAFRGIVQARMEPAFGLWTTVIIIAAVNVVSHRWGPEIVQNWLGLFVTLAGWTWLRSWSGSIWPPLVMHAGLNLLVALGLWNFGPLHHAELSSGVVAGFALLGVASLFATVALSRNSRVALTHSA
ncbi:MAG: CPBP family intramembrane metalloprotease [Gammaproteobacteria bacterium]|nr:CPBP family intramembrane metalloprotease [Gammaproteobacteria bacterium]